jgi:acetyl esterase/lipase
VSSRPDFAVLAYPVISFVAPYAHTGSAEGLLGKDADARLLEELSADKRVTASTPPTFLFHTNGDNGVPPENSIAYYLALRAAHVPAELHVYEKGPHGVGLAPNDPVLSSWGARLADWFKTRGIVEAPAPCKIATKGTSPVARACQSAGMPAAKVKMRDMVAAAKLHGRGFACEDCHGKEGLVTGADKKFLELVQASRIR